MVQLSLKNSTFDLNKAIERMTTGYKINSAKDDAAGYAVAKKMQVELSSASVVESNISMGLSLLETANSSVDILTNHLQRIRDLCEEAANGTYGADSIAAIKAEVDARTSEIQRIIDTTQYNGIKLFGSSTSSGTTNLINDVVRISEDNVPSGFTAVKTEAELAYALNNNENVVLMNDITLSNWTPVSTYSGTIDGNGYKMSASKSINSGTWAFIKDAQTGAVIKNLEMDVNLEASHAEIANMIFDVTGNVTIDNCRVTGRVNDYVTSGGFVSTVNGTLTITNSSFDGMCNGGGLVGKLYGDINIDNCNVSGNIYSDNTSITPGGLISYYGGHGNVNISNTVVSATIDNSFDASDCGGFIGVINAPGFSGSFNISNSYTTLNNAAGSHYGMNNVFTGYQKTDAELADLIAAKGKGEILVMDSSTNINLQIGTDSSSNSQLSVSTGLALSNLSSISSGVGTSGVLSTIDDLISTLTSYQTNIGASINRLESAQQANSIKITNLTSSLSTIRDADIAQESSNYIKAQILQQASASLLATANQIPSIALQLI